ncbi:MAG: cation transporter [Algoriphagus sp.]|uniref:cation diffusion facilitator family transporter n=1 Tax=Algoriphagus sp. TaxID=1872435 RepID=UPI001859CB8E|nr:cation diffusion facilitator family transporter [Algoriphagus sp.]NVJ87215.1 cation transporter [Algoriphagus sp.]
MASHSHHSHHNHTSGKNLKTAFLLNLGFTIFELIGGFYVNSVAIISDAIHDLGDSISLGTAWYLDTKSKQKPTRTFTFGYRRFSLLGALINSLVLIVGSIYVIIEAIGRIIEPELIDPQGMLIFAIIGVGVNGFAAWKMSKGKSLNERVISWHLLEDVLGWFAILVAAVILQFWDIPYLDPALSLGFGMFILSNVFLRLKETLMVFLQGHPEDVDREKIEKELLAIDKIESIHHMHIWSLDGEHHVFSAHFKLKEITGLEELLIVKNQIKAYLKKYNFEHLTVEIETANECCEFSEEMEE